MLSPLTPRQKEILDFINTYISIHKIAPSLKEIKSHFNLKAISTVHEHIEKLKRKGYLHKEMNQARGIRTTTFAEATDHTVNLNILGKIAAGNPIEPIELPEPLVIGIDLLPKSAQSAPEIATQEYYALVVDGESMVNEGILPEDIVVVKYQNHAKNGEMVVAVIKDDGENYESATLKRYYMEPGRIRLQPANDKMEPIYCQRVEVRGIVVGLIRKY